MNQANPNELVTPYGFELACKLLNSYGLGIGSNFAVLALADLAKITDLCQMNCNMN